MHTILIAFSNKIRIFAILAASLVSLLILVGNGFGRTLTVSQEGDGDFEHIQAAIAEASAGDSIHVGPGTYEGPLNISKSVIVQGSGIDQTVLISPLVAVIIRADDVAIEQFKVLANGNGRSLISAISCDGCSGTIVNTIIRGAHSAVRIIGDASLTLHYNDLDANLGVELIGTSNPIDARFNWWGISDSKLIPDKIWDGEDQEELGLVIYAPFLINQNLNNPITTSKNYSSWGNIKSITKDRIP